jgi:hypothetical protein
MEVSLAVCTSLRVFLLTSFQRDLATNEAG